MFAKALVGVGLARRGHDRVDGVDHRFGIAPGVVAAEQITAQAAHHKSLSGTKHLRLGTAEAVNALFGVAHQEHAGRRTCTRVADEPGVQRLPLQRVGVLELVDHQMPDARVQPLLHPARQHRVGQHQQRGAFDVIHVDPAAVALQGGELGNQHTRQTRHALLVQPGVVLLAGRHHAQHQVLGHAHLFDTDDFFAELARRALVGQQGRDGRRQVAGRQRALQLHPLGRKSRCARAAQRHGGVTEGLPVNAVGAEQLFRFIEAAKFGELQAKRLHRAVDHTFFIGQRELGALVERGLQGLVSLETPIGQHHRLKVGLERRISRNRRIKPSPHQRARRCVVLQQLVVHRQFQALQHRHRRAAQQGRKPAVEGADLHRAAAGQNGAI